MAITDINGLIAAPKQRLNFFKTASVTTVAAIPFSVIDQAGDPAAGSLNPSNTTTGVVPTDATAGTPSINAFGGSATGYLSRVLYGNTVLASMLLYDRLFSVGNITMTTSTATTTLSTQPSYSGRLPNTDYKGLEIWLEVGGTALSNHAHTVSVTYMKEDAATGGRSTGNMSTQNLISRRMFRFPLQAGDAGVSKIEAVVANGVTSSSGVFNIHVMRPLWAGRVYVAGMTQRDGPHETGMPIVYADSSLFLIVQADSTASGLPWLQLEIANG